jgi:hypothetical protein
MGVHHMLGRSLDRGSMTVIGAENDSGVCRGREKRYPGGLTRMEAYPFH